MGHCIRPHPPLQFPHKEEVHPPQGSQGLPAQKLPAASAPPASSP